MAGLSFIRCSVKAFWAGILLPLAVALLVFSSFCFAGCQSSPNLPAKPSGKSQPITLTFSTWGSSQEMAVLHELLVKFEAENPDVKVKLLHIPDNYFQKLHILIAGGLAPDVMFINSLSYPIYASHGLFLDLTPYVERPAFYPQALDSFHHKKADNEKPLLGAIPRDVSNLLVYYNKDWFKKRRVPMPAASWTWQDFVRVAKQLSEDKNRDGVNERFGVSFYAKPPLFWLPFVWSAGAEVFDAPMNRVVLDSPAALEGLGFVQDLRWKFHVAPRQVESGGMAMSQMFLQEKVAMLVSGRWSVPVFHEQARFDWDVLPLPVGPSGKSRVGIDASGYAVSKTSGHLKEAIRLAQFLTSKTAIETVTRSGLIVPARIDVAESDVFLSPGKRPVHSRYFLTVIADGVPTRTPPRWNEFSEELLLGLQPVWDGQKSPKEAMSRDFLNRLNQLLAVEDKRDE